MFTEREMELIAQGLALLAGTVNRDYANAGTPCQAMRASEKRDMLNGIAAKIGYVLRY